MTLDDRFFLKHLSALTEPIWGAHLKRGKPLGDASIKRWLERGWVEQVGDEGYRITARGRDFLKKER